MLIFLYILTKNNKTLYNIM